MDIKLTLLDRAVLSRDGVPVRLEPRFMAVLIRLALDLGKTVRADELSREVLQPVGGTPPSTGVGGEELRRRRLHVYKCISALRVALDPDRPGEASTLLRGDRGRNPGYRLELPAENIDLLRFEHLATASLGAPPVRAVAQLRQAVELWRGRPLIDVEHHAWARRRVARLLATYDDVRLRLFELYETFDQVEPALKLGRAILAEQPGDDRLRDRLALLARRRRVGANDLRYPTGWFDGMVSIRIGDLFEQDDAHLVIGFSDTFDTNTDDDLVVSRASVQGQLLHRLYGGDRRLLDRELRRALRHAPRSVETRASKPYGKLTRHPLGTVAVLRQGDRRVFAVAYSKVDARGLYVRSSPGRLRRSLDRLWHAVRLEGQHRPVAVPIVGSGLARIDDLDRTGLIRLIVASFLANQSDGRVSDELRIVILPRDAANMDLNRVDEAVAAVIAEALPKTGEGVSPAGHKRGRDRGGHSRASGRSG